MRTKLMALQNKWQPSKSRNEQRAKHQHTYGIRPAFQALARDQPVLQFKWSSKSILEKNPLDSITNSCGIQCSTTRRPAVPVFCGLWPINRRETKICDY
jgi:ribonuclease I